jgi:hypothetical protein
MAMDLIKSVTFGTIMAAAIALVIGSQGTSAGPLAIRMVEVADVRFFWSWPVFFTGTGLSFGLLLLQR